MYKYLVSDLGADLFCYRVHELPAELRPVIFMPYLEVFALCAGHKAHSAVLRSALLTCCYNSGRK